MCTRHQSATTGELEVGILSSVQAITRSRVAAASTMTVVAALVGVSLITASAAKSRQFHLTSGQAWLASPEHGFVSLIDGPSNQVVGRVAVFESVPGGDTGALEVIQNGSSAVVTSKSRGVVSVVDGATMSVRTTKSLAAPGGDLSVLVSGQVAVAIDPHTNQAQFLSASDLSPTRTVPVAASPGPHQAMMTTDGTLFVIDANGSGLNWYDIQGAHGPAAARCCPKPAATGRRPP